MDEAKANIFLTIMAYASGAWSPEEVIKAYEYVHKEMTKAVPEGKVRMFKAVDSQDGEISH